jgi:GMP synthase (glutamine-hydrolysing)
MLVMALSNKIVVVVTGEPPDDVRALHGDYPTMFARAIGDAHDGGYAAVDARVEEIPEAQALVLTGSSAGVHAREPWMLQSEARLRELVARRIPVLGVCFGHQLLAQALGGSVTPHPGGREMSTVAVERLADDPLFEGVAPSFDANACHCDTVVELPPGALVLAKNQHDRHQVLRFGPRAYGVQFHPEFDGAIMRAYVDARSELLHAEGLDAGALRARALDTPSARRILQNFVRRLVTPA